MGRIETVGKHKLWGSTIFGETETGDTISDTISQMICLVVRLLMKPGQEGAAAKIFRKLMVESRREPGCLMYLVHQHVDDPRRFLVYEQYRDQAALDSHRASSHFKKYVSEGVNPMVEERVNDLYTLMTFTP